MAYAPTQFGQDPQYQAFLYAPVGEDQRGISITVLPILARLGGAAIAKYWSCETPFYDIEARMRHKEGHWVWVPERVFARTKDGRP